MSITKEKIIKFTVEGKILRKTLCKIIKELGIDRLIGIIARKITFSNSRVVKNRIFFNTFQGDYTCNPKYITEQLIRDKVDCEIIWGVRKSQIQNRNDIPEKVKLVDRYTYDFYEYMSTSKIWIINSVEIFKNPIDKKKGQFLFQTWHGSLGIKRFDKGVNSGRAWVKAAELSSNITNYCISNSKFENKVLKESFWDKSVILEYGHPRNDILFGQDDRYIYIKHKIQNKYQLKDHYKYVLYAPTFRDAKNFDCYSLDFKKLIETLSLKFSGKWKILVRYHPTVRDVAFGKLLVTENVIDVTKYPDIQELMVFCDIAITDYSSWIYDFVLTRKPGFIFATDIDLYNHERGFYYPLESTPFPVATNNDELTKNILYFDIDKYHKKVEEFLLDKGCVEDGKASERVVKKIKEIIGAE